MLPHHHDSIIAIASAPGRGAVGIVRVSGAEVPGLIDALLGQPLLPRHAHYLPFRAGDGAVIDQGLALHFPAPHSYTGEDVLELQAHGGPVLLQLLVARCLELMPRLRLARPGEFTERAFLNDKLDLAQAEAVADLIDASTEAAARSAGRALAGAFSREVDTLAAQLIELRALVEATLDFPEEEIDFLRQADASGRLARIAAALKAVFERARQGVLLREGLRVLLAEQPNVGKSSLLNALAGAEFAIVTPIPGTTRDRLSQTIQIEGVPLHITDTAGLRDSQTAPDEVERIGIERSWAAINEADVVVFLHDLARRDVADYRAAEAEIESGLQQAGIEVTRILDVYNKADLAPAPPGELALCAATGEGLEGLRQALLQRAGWQAQPEGVFIARERHLAALRACREHVEQAIALIAAPTPALELLAEELRLAHEALASITGAFSADDLLGEIFGRFCIGK